MQSKDGAWSTGGAAGELRTQAALGGAGGSRRLSDSSLRKTASSVVTADGIVHIDNFIPLRYPDLRDRLIEDFPEAFYEPRTRMQFFALADRISLRNQIRLSQAFRELQEQYAFLDPDVDMELPDPGARMTEEARAYLAEQFESGLADLFAKGGFEELTKQELSVAFKNTGVANGMKVLPPNPDKLEYKCYCRGRRDVEVEYSSWRTLWFKRTSQVKLLQRLAIVFKINVPDGDAELLKRRKEGWFRRTFINPFKYKRYQVAENPIKAEWTYLKLFKDIEIADVDMLLPGSVIKFSWFDYLMIYGPILFGLGSAIYKSATGSVDFSDYQSILTSLVLIVVPITWGLRAYFAVKEKEQAYEAYMNKLLLLHNLNNNAGVISQMLDGAREQEDNEALLAYFFLWRGDAAPQPRERSNLDARVEDWLNCIMKEAMQDKARAKERRDSSGGRGSSGGSSGTDGRGSSAAVEQTKIAALLHKNQVAPDDSQQQQQMQQMQQGQQTQQRALGPQSVAKGLEMVAVRDFTIDFEVTDAVDKLAAMEVLKQLPAPGGADESCAGDQLLQVLGLDAAVEALALSNIRQPSVDGSMARRSTRAQGPSMWHECWAAYPYTGQAFRFFFNPDTGESTYEEPKCAYVPAVSSVPMAHTSQGPVPGPASQWPALSSSGPAAGAPTGAQQHQSEFIGAVWPQQQPG